MTELTTDDLVAEVETLSQGYPYHEPSETIRALTSRVDDGVLLGPAPDTIVAVLGLIAVAEWAVVNDDSLLHEIRSTAKAAVNAWADTVCDHDAHPGEAELENLPDDATRVMAALADPDTWESEGLADEGHTADRWRCARAVADYARFLLDDLPVPGAG